MKISVLYPSRAPWRHLLPVTRSYFTRFKELPHSRRVLIRICPWRFRGGGNFTRRRLANTVHESATDRSSRICSDVVCPARPHSLMYTSVFTTYRKQYVGRPRGRVHTANKHKYGRRNSIVNKHTTDRQTNGDKSVGNA